MKSVNYSKLKGNLLGALALLMLSWGVYAATVPEGVILAEEQVLVRGNGAEPQTLDPQIATGVPASMILRDLFETLMIEVQGKITYGQAESYEVSKDKLIYTFKLKKGLRWSNGDKLVAGDFEYAFKRGVDPDTASGYAWYFEITGIKNAKDIIAGKMSPDMLGVKATDDRTLVFTLAQPTPYFVESLAHVTMSPVNKKVVEKYGTAWTKPANMVSNGPYKMREWIVNEKIVLVRNKYYWNNKTTVINQVTFLPIPKESVELNRFKAGEIDITSNLPNDQFKALKRDIPNQVRILPRLGTYYYYLNMRRKPFDNKNVRLALSYAIDRDIITKKVLGTGEKPAYGFAPDNIAGFKPDVPAYGKWSQKERNKKALALMKKAGFTKNNPLELELLYNTSEAHKKVAIAISSMWKVALEGAVKVNLKNQEWKIYLDEKKAGNFDVSRAGWIGDYNEASTMLDLLTEGHSYNNSDYKSALYNEYMQSAKKSKTVQQRNNYYKKADALIAKDMPIIPIYHYVTKKLVKPYVGGVPEVTPLGNLYTRDFYIIKH